jgi:hypothetical protein
MESNSTQIGTHLFGTQHDCFVGRREEQKKGGVGQSCHLGLFVGGSTGRISVLRAVLPRGKKAFERKLVRRKGPSSCFFFPMLMLT